MKIIYNQDGSIKGIQLSHYINQNNNNVDKISVAIVGKTPSEYVATAYFTLPDGTKNFLLISSTETVEIGGLQESGVYFYLTNAQTVYAGVLKMTIEFKDAEDTRNVLFTYNTEFTINPTGALPNETNITLAEYNSLVDAINSIVVGTTTWGNIIGTLSNQQDLQAALNAKANEPVRNIAYLNEAPTEDNTSERLAIVILDEEPEEYFDGYLYIIKSQPEEVGE